MKIIKKDKTLQEFDINKVIAAVKKSAARKLYTFTDEELDSICKSVENKAKALNKDNIDILEMHAIVEKTL